MKRNDARTTRLTLGQVIVCMGCCCGRTDKGHPEVPVDWLKAEWRRRGLAKQIQLTISGCLGPCDASNVALVFIGDQPVWLGGLHERRHFQELLEWATVCSDTGSLRPLPHALGRFEMQRFREEALGRRPGFEEVA